MTKQKADKMLMEHFEELDRKADVAAETEDTNEEYMQLVDSMLKVYTMLAGTNGFDSDAVKIPSGTGNIAM